MSPAKIKKVDGKKAQPSAPFSSVRKRDGRVVPFDETRITFATLKAMQATN